MNNFGVGYAEDLKNGCNSRGEAIILNPSRRDTTIIHYSLFNIHYSIKFQIAQQSDKQEFDRGQSVDGQLSTVNCQLSTVHCPLSTVN